MDFGLRIDKIKKIKNDKNKNKTKNTDKFKRFAIVIGFI